MATNQERFWSMVSGSNKSGCRIWTGAINQSNGRGMFNMVLDESQPQYHDNTTLVYAHRYALLGNECQKEALQALHRPGCTSKLCCEPTHLYLGTDADNKADAVSEGAYPKGEKRKQAIFTDEEVRGMFRRKFSGESGYSIAKSYDTAPQHINMILRGAVWKHIWSEFYNPDGSRRG